MEKLIITGCETLANHMAKNSLKRLTIFTYVAKDNIGIEYFITKSCRERGITEHSIVYYGTRGTEKVYCLSNHTFNGMLPGQHIANY